MRPSVRPSSSRYPEAWLQTLRIFSSGSGLSTNPYPRPDPPLPPEPTEALVKQHHLRNVEPGCMTSAARYKREDDLPLVVVADISGDRPVFRG